MTNRDPYVPDFTRKVVDFVDCLNDYFKISSEEKLKQDLLKPDIELVCNYERHELIKHSRKYNGLNYNDFVKLPNLLKEKEFLNKIGLDI